jgi:hypothetical protein
MSNPEGARGTLPRRRLPPGSAAGASSSASQAQNLRRMPSSTSAEETGKPDADNYEVGYGKPPKKHQFKKGEIANPRGRGAKRPLADDESLIAAILAEMEQSIDITEGSRSKRVRKTQVLAKSLMNKAMKGDHQAIKTLIALLKDAGTRGGNGNADVQQTEEELSVADADILEQFRQQTIATYLAAKAARK